MQYSLFFLCIYPRPLIIPFFLWCGALGSYTSISSPPVSSPFSLLLYTTPFSFFTYPLFYMSIPFPLNTVLLQVLQSGCNEKRNLVWNVLFTYWCLLSHNFLPIGMWDAPTLWWWMRFILRVIWWCWCSSFEFGHVVVPILHRLIKWRHLDGIVPANTTVFVFNSHPWHSFNILAQSITHAQLSDRLRGKWFHPPLFHMYSTWIPSEDDTDTLHLGISLVIIDQVQLACYLYPESKHRIKSIVDVTKVWILK